MEGIELLEPWIYICLKVTKIIVNFVTIGQYLHKILERWLCGPAVGRQLSSRLLIIEMNTGNTKSNDRFARAAEASAVRTRHG